MTERSSTSFSVRILTAVTVRLCAAGAFKTLDKDNSGAIDLDIKEVRFPFEWFSYERVRFTFVLFTKHTVVGGW